MLLFPYVLFYFYLFNRIFIYRPFKVVYSEALSALAYMMLNVVMSEYLQSVPKIQHSKLKESPQITWYATRSFICIPHKYIGKNSSSMHGLTRVSHSDHKSTLPCTNNIIYYNINHVMHADRQRDTYRFFKYAWANTCITFGP